MTLTHNNNYYLDFVGTYNERQAQNLYLTHIILLPRQVLLDMKWYMGHLRKKIKKHMVINSWKILSLIKEDPTLQFYTPG